MKNVQAILKIEFSLFGTLCNPPRITQLILHPFNFRWRFFEGSFSDPQTKSYAPINIQKPMYFLLLCLINIWIYISVLYKKTFFFSPHWTVNAIKVGTCLSYLNLYLQQTHLISDQYLLNRREYMWIGHITKSQTGIFQVTEPIIFFYCILPKWDYLSFRN